MKKTIYLLASVSCVLGAQLARAQGQGYQLDPTFGTAGKVLTSISTPPASTDKLLDIEALPANKLLALVKGSSGLTKLLYNADGSLDTSYGTAGRLALASLPAGFTPNENPNLAYDLLSDGRVLVEGSQTTATNSVLVLYAADGSFAPGFGTNGVLPLGTAITSYVLQRDGKVLVASSTDVTTTVGSYAGGQMKLTRLLPTGDVEFTKLLTHLLTAPAMSVGRQAIVVGTSLAVQADGSILAVGTGTERYTSNQFLVLARLLADGTPDTSFGTDGTNTLYYQTAVNPGGGVTLAGGNRGIMPQAGGRFLLNITRGQLSVLAFTAAGQVDTSYGTQGVGAILSTQVINLGDTYLQPDGSVLAGGAAANMLAARLTSQGVFDPSLSPTPSTTPYLRADFGGQAIPQDIDTPVKILTLPTGELVLAGSSLRASATGARPAGSLVALARYKAGSALATAAGASQPVVQLYPNPMTGSELHLAGLASNKPCTVTVYNALGQAVRTLLLPAQAGAAARTLQVPALGTGMYRVRVASEQGATTQPLVVQ